jgi:hypothetical protein
MQEQSKIKETAVISTRTNPELKKTVDEEAQLRGHSTSEAVEKMIQLGLPKYKKQFPRVFERIDNVA